jgi:CubicO group peptidase (beta-lactamase class C family)
MTSLGSPPMVTVTMTYPELLRAEITGPLELNDTVVKLSLEQEKRFAQGHNAQHQLPIELRPCGLGEDRKILSPAPRRLLAFGQHFSQIKPRHWFAPYLARFPPKRPRQFFLATYSTFRL